MPFESWGATLACVGDPIATSRRLCSLRRHRADVSLPGRVFVLLGNHEHAHIGGPRTSLFARDGGSHPGAAHRDRKQQLADRASFVAAALGGDVFGLLFSHTAPGPDSQVLVTSSSWTIACTVRLRVVQIPSEVGRETRPTPPPCWDGCSGAPACRQTWRVSPGSAGPDPQHLRTLIIPAGYQTIGSQQLILSSSFGMEDAYKRSLS